MPRALAMCCLLLIVGCGRNGLASAAGDRVSDIAPDETVVFFNTSGWLDETTQQWHLPVHGWIHEREKRVVRKAALELVLREKFDLTASEQTEPNFSRRVNLLFADNERGKTIVVRIAGATHELPESAENGHFEKTIVISAADAARHSDDGFIRYRAVTRNADAREFSGSVRLVGPEGLSVISDIDDTVKISEVVDRRSLLEHTFLLDFVAAPGMADLYRRWSGEGVAFHYVSSSPWQLYEPLDEFLAGSGFPWSTFSLKPVRFRDETLLDLFKKGTETKPRAIEAILDRYPARQFVLVGDSGEQDPEVYAAMMRRRPDQIAKVYIRNVTQESADNARFTTLFADIDRNRWQLFDDPKSLAIPDNP